MPCDRVYTVPVIPRVTLDLQGQDSGLLKRAAERAGYEYVLQYGQVVIWAGNKKINVDQNRATIDQGSEELIHKLNRAYTMETILDTAQEFGMTVNIENEQEQSLMFEGTLEFAFD